MLGILLTAGAALFEEISLSVGKWEAARGKENIFSLGFLNYFWMTLLFFMAAFLIPKDFFAPGFPRGFVFSTDSLPTLLIRLVLEILQATVAAYATIRADRSTVGFLGILTIPLVLGVDTLLSYTISLSQISGMALIVTSLILVAVNNGIGRTGAWLVTFTAVNAVATITLFKYDVTHFNSIEAEQTIITLALVVFFFLVARVKTGQHPFRLLLHPIFFAQSLLMGIGGSVMSFAYAFGSASVIASAKRALNILFSILSGNIYFHEKKFWLKITSFVLVVSGLALLVH